MVEINILLREGMRNMSTSDNPDKKVMKSRIEEVMSRILSEKHDAKIKIKFVPKDEENQKK